MAKIDTTPPNCVLLRENSSPIIGSASPIITRSIMSIIQIVLSSPTVIVVVRRIDLLSNMFCIDLPPLCEGSSTVARSDFIMPPELRCAAWTDEVWQRTRWPHWSVRPITDRMFRRAVQRHSGEIPGDAVTRALTAQSSVHGVYDVLRGGRSRGKSSHRKVTARPLSVMPPRVS